MCFYVANVIFYKAAKAVKEILLWIYVSCVSLNTNRFFFASFRSTAESLGSVQRPPSGDEEGQPRTN